MVIWPIKGFLSSLKTKHLGSGILSDYAEHNIIAS